MNIRLRFVSSVVLLVIASLTIAPLSASAQTSSAPTYSYTKQQFTAELIALTNQDRTDAGVGAVKESVALSRAAQAKADDMMAKGYFSHASPSGQAPWVWFKENGYTYRYAAENIATNFYTPEALQNAWMNSPAHRANIVNGKYTEVGFGYVRGVYQGKSTLFIVEFFAAPAVASAKAGTPSTTKARTSRR